MAKVDANVIIVGGGIAGVSLAARLAGRAQLLERETLLAAHTTGRSAALFSQTYGNAFVRDLTRESRAVFETPPEGFTQTPLLSLRPSLFVARPADAPMLEQSLAENSRTMRALSQAEVLEKMPVLRAGVFSTFAEEPGSMDIDVAALFDGFRRMALSAGAEISTDRAVTHLSREGGAWRATMGDDSISGAVVVNAAGAWAGRIGLLAGLGDRGLMPLRRTIVAFDPPENADVSGWMFVHDVGNAFYFKSDAGLVLASAEAALAQPVNHRIRNAEALRRPAY